MDLNGIFINESIMDHIFENNLYIDKIRFSYINNYTYKRYRNILKNGIMNHINTDYKLFYDCINRYKYTEEVLLQLMDKSICDINPVMCGMHQYYDLRFIFELIYINNELYNNIGYIDDKKKNLLKIIQSIRSTLSFDRKNTINNINNLSNPMLYSLKEIFDPLLYRTHADKWTRLYM